jgi:hypothetical protein
MRYNNIMDNLFLRIIRQWVPIGVTISVLTFIIYLTIQQDIRIGANEPQIQIAEDMASELNSGQTPAISGKIDISKSLAPFTIIYNKQGNVKISDAELNQKVPVVPMGVLNGTIKEGTDTDQPGENRVTWQPQVGVRLATVVVSYNKGYVLVGRNMREIEIQEDQEFTNILFGWIIALVATFSSVYVMQTIMKSKK